jgi:general stress protein CsbA
MFAADYPFLDILWTMILFFTWVAWIWMIVIIFSDIFRRTDIGGWSKALWCVFLIVLPFLGALIYLIAQHDGIAQRNLDHARLSQERFEEHVRHVAGHNGHGAAEEIKRAHELLEAGTINQTEYEQMKAKALV